MQRQFDKQPLVLPLGWGDCMDHFYTLHLSRWRVWSIRLAPYVFRWKMWIGPVELPDYYVMKPWFGCHRCSLAMSCWKMQGLPWERCCLSGSICFLNTWIYLSALMFPFHVCNLSINVSMVPQLCSLPFPLLSRRQSINGFPGFLRLVIRLDYLCEMHLKTQSCL